LDPRRSRGLDGEHGRDDECLLDYVTLIIASVLAVQTGRFAAGSNQRACIQGRRVSR
jgi:hypothetical protein